MNLWQKTATAMLRLLMASVLILSLTSCGEKAVSQEPYNSLQEKAQLSKQISEVSPPATIQELRSALEIYQPQVTIVTPKQDEILQDDTVTVRFQVKDLPIYKDPKLELGPHLEVILDNEPLIAVYNLNNPLVLPDLPPGTHTLRVFASRPWDESFKNEGAYAQTKFHVVTKTDDNNPEPAKPLLTYTHPKGSYGAEPILLDFYLTNAPLHLVATENPDDDIADWRIRCTINDESFVLDRWQSVYLKGFKPGKNWVKLEFLDEQGNPVKNVFNSTVRLITYEPNGKDTLSKIVRGELSADQVRSIVDQNYTTEIPTAEPTPTPTLTPSVKGTPETQPIPEPTPTPTLTPSVKGTPETQPIPEPTPTPTLTPSVEETPQTQLKEEKTPVPESGSVPQTQEKPKSAGYFNRFQRRTDKIPTPQPTVEPTPSLSPTLPEVIETPQPEPELTPVPKKVVPHSEGLSRFSRYFKRQPYKTATPEAPVETTPDSPTTLPEIIESPAPETIVPQLQTTPEPKSEVTPTPEKQSEEIQQAQ
ncbi:hypothetical protein [Brasilonema sennae]|nr:hypothetical protein [Brasilonema sennae]